MSCVPWINALRGESEVEANTRSKARELLQDGPDDFIGGPWIARGFEHHEHARLKQPAHRLSGPTDGGKVRATLW